MILAVQIVAVDQIAVAVDLITFIMNNKILQHEDTEKQKGDAK